MSILFGKGPGKPKELNEKLEPPKGWFTAEELQKNYVINENENPEEIQRFITERLPMAAKRTERLIDAVQKKLNIEIPESYLRVRADAGFQVLLLVSQDDFSSPKIAAARLLAEEFANAEAYDIAFTFSVQSQSVVNSTLLPNEYKLKHVQQHINTQQGMQHMY